MLLGTDHQTVSAHSGNFQLPGVGLALGDNTFTVYAEDVAGNSSQSSVVIQHMSEPQASDVVLDWNHVALEAIRLDATAPPVASRGLAMVSLAVYDVVSAIEGTPGYYVTRSAPAGASAIAGVAAAAHRVLTYLYPAQAATFDSALAAWLDWVPDGASENEGVALGQAIGDAIVALRANDGWDDFVGYSLPNQLGNWQPTAPMFDVALLPQWADLEPARRSSGPPAPRN